MEELTGHRVFIRTAELSSITKAAESLGLTRAAASRALMSLESELGAALFTRTTRHVALTAFGSQVLDTCKELVGLADQLKAEALHQSSAPTGTIRVACSVSFGQTYLAGALKRFLGEFPSINMELTLLDRPAHLLTDNIDLALEVTNTPEPGLIARRLTSCGSLLCAAPAFLADRPPVTARFIFYDPADLAKLPTLVSTRFGSRWKFEREGESSEVEVKGRIRTNDTQVILRAALDGLGIALLPDLTISDPVEKGELTTLLPDWKTESVGIYALYASRRYQLPAVRAFIDFLVADIRK